jgi:2-C-methyl-D-erythritol 4-phosphate cytidylyltransferase
VERVWWVVVAAGQSTRMGALGPKMWLQVEGCSIMEWTLSAIRASVPTAGGVLVVRQSDRARSEDLLRSHFPSGAWTVAEGGANRSDSVCAGLHALRDYQASNDDMVLIHDGARPALAPSLVERIIEGVRRYRAAVPVVPVSDTVKRVVWSEQQVTETMDRSALGLAQTPQGFIWSDIWSAYAALPSDAVVTDDAEVMERSGQSVALVLGDLHNRKLTTAEDLSWFAWQMARRRGDQ